MINPAKHVHFYCFRNILIIVA